MSLSKRIELPYSAGTICEVRKEKRRVVLTFFQNNNQIGTKSFVGEISEDSLVVR